MNVFLSQSQLNLIKSNEPIDNLKFKVLDTNFVIMAIKNPKNPREYNLIVKNSDKNKLVDKVFQVSDVSLNKRVFELKRTVEMKHRLSSVSPKVKTKISRKVKK